MKKVFLIFFGLMAVIAFFYCFMSQHKSGMQTDTFTIALVGPMEKDIGKNMRRGVELCLRDNREKMEDAGINIELQIYDDQDNPEKARDIAERIAANNKVLIVIGHFNDPLSMAGKTYRKYQIPIISGSTMTKSITIDNQWYFSVMPDHSYYGEFMANCIRAAFKKNKACLVSASNDFGISFEEGFENAAKESYVIIENKIQFRVHEKTDDEVKRILEILKEENDLEMLVLALPAAQGAELVKAVREAGIRMIIIGPYTFSNQEFIRKFQNLPKNYLRDVFFISPFINDYNEKARSFKKAFLQDYKSEPKWISAAYYDAFLVAQKVIQLSEIIKKGNIWKDRKDVRQTLDDIFHPDHAVKGVTGDIFFDKQGTAIKTLTLAYYKNEKQLPLNIQFKIMSDVKDQQLLFNNILKEDVFFIGNIFFKKIAVVQTGIEVNEIKILDIKQGIYEIDFYTWFQFHKDYDLANIEFDYMSDLSFSKIKSEPKLDSNFRTDVIHIRAKLTIPSDFKSYPLNSLALPIIFRHAELSNEELVYYPSSAQAIHDSLTEKSEGGTKINLSGWKMDDEISVKQSIRKYILPASKIGNQSEIHFSQFDAEIILTKNISLIFRQVYPLLFISIALLISFFIPVSQINLRLIILCVCLAVTLSFHAKLLLDMPLDYLTNMEYFLFFLYLVIITNLFHSQYESDRV